MNVRVPGFFVHINCGMQINVRGYSITNSVLMIFVS